jgi:HPt (histidine-containing phosphotransfer) domain-containing protein
MTEKIKVNIDEDFEGIVEPYLDNIRDDIMTIGEHLDKSDFQNIQLITHQIIGSGRSFGFEFISDSGEIMDMAAKTEDGHKIRKTLRDLAEYLDTVEIHFVPVDG